MSKTAPLYLRLPSELRDQVDRLADASGGSLTVAVAQLVDVGLRNGDADVAELHERITTLESEVKFLRSDRDAVQAELTRIREEASHNRAVIESVLQRLRLPVGTCPTCRTPVTGHEVFVDGACSNGHSLQGAVLSPTPKSTLNQSDLLAALAVVGIALGVAAMVSMS